MSPGARVGIVVLNYRNYTDTLECVRALDELDFDDHHVVIVDNASPNESEVVLRRTFPGHTVLQSGANRGYAAGNNVGIRYLLDRGVEWVVVLNNDVLVAPDFLTGMLGVANSRADAGVLGALILNGQGSADRISARRVPPLGEIFWNRGPGKWLGAHRGLERRAYYASFDKFDEPTQVEVVSGSCLMLRATLLEEIGLLDERTFLFWEEFILAEKVRHTRLKTYLVPCVRVIHKGGRSVRTIGSRAARAYLMSLNHYLGHYRNVGLFRRYLTLAGPAVVFVPGILRAALRRRADSS